MRSLIRLLEFTQPYWRRSLITLLSLLSITALSLIVPALIKQVIDFGLGGDHPEFMPVAGLILIGIGLVRSGFNFVQRYNAEWLSQRMAYDIRNALNDRLQRLSFGYHDHAQTGQLLSRCTEDVTSVQRFVGYALLDLINIVLLMTGIVFIMFRTDAHLALLALIPIPFLGWFTVRFRLSVQPLFTRVQQALSGMSTVMQESLTGVQVVKAFAREPHEFKRFELRNQQLYDSRLRIIRNWGNVMPLMSFIIACSTAILLLFGGRQVIDGTLTLGDLAAFNSYVLMLAMPVQRLGWLVNIMSEAAAWSGRIYEVLDTRPDIQDAADAIELPALGGRVEVDCVSFKYAGTRPDLSDV